MLVKQWASLILCVIKCSCYLVLHSPFTLYVPPLMMIGVSSFKLCLYPGFYDLSVVFFFNVILTTLSFSALAQPFRSSDTEPQPQLPHRHPVIRWNYRVRRACRGRTTSRCRSDATLTVFRVPICSSCLVPVELLNTRNARPSPLFFPFDFLCVRPVSAC